MDSNKKNRWNLISRWMQGLALSGVLLTVVLPSGNAQELTTMAARTESVSVPLNKSRLVQLGSRARKVSVGSPEVADILILRSDQIYVLGKKLGTTNVIVWDARDQLVAVLDVEVTHDLNALKAKIYEFLPGEEIKVQSSQNKLVLSGQVSTAEKMNTAMQLAQTFVTTESKGADKNKPAAPDASSVINMMSIGGAQQVMLEVTVAEVQRSLVRQFDSNFLFTRNGGSFTYGGVSGGATFPDLLVADPVLGDVRVPVFGSNNGALAGSAMKEVLTNPAIDNKGLFGSYLSGNALFNVAFNIAKQNGMAKVLAEPTLISLSGSKADFLSGGEFPVPVPDDDGLTIEYKEFGVGLQFQPTVLDSDRINLNLDVAVSELSNANAVTINPGSTESNFVIPSLTKRSAKTTVELGNGQTIGIAGLLNENLTDFVEKLPGLGDIPVLGQLFRSQQFRKGETELVILVTPRLAKPIRREDVTLPTDNFVEPSDVDYYLLGKMSRLEKPKLATTEPVMSDEPDAPTGNPAAQSGMEGQFGHDL